eukprot:Rmarinus@m.8238
MDDDESVHEATYEGDRNELKERHGKGKATFENGEIYEGDYVHGKREGHGSYTYKDTSTYEGEWFDGKRHGKGKMTYADGSSYDGDWNEGQRSGIGMYYFKNGDIYSGSWKAGKKHGDGILVSNVNKTQLVGVWENGEFKTGRWTQVSGTAYEGAFDPRNLNKRALENVYTVEVPGVEPPPSVTTYPKGDGMWVFPQQAVVKEGAYMEGGIWKDDKNFRDIPETFTRNGKLFSSMHYNYKIVFDGLVRGDSSDKVDGWEFIREIQANRYRLPFQVTGVVGVDFLDMLARRCGCGDEPSVPWDCFLSIIESAASWGLDLFQLSFERTRPSNNTESAREQARAVDEQKESETRRAAIRHIFDGIDVGSKEILRVDEVIRVLRQAPNAQSIKVLVPDLVGVVEPLLRHLGEKNMSITWRDVEKSLKMSSPV